MLIRASRVRICANGVVAGVRFSTLTLATPSGDPDPFTLDGNILTGGLPSRFDLRSRVG